MNDHGSVEVVLNHGLFSGYDEQVAENEAMALARLRLNGWTRLGIVLSGLWIVASGIYAREMRLDLRFDRVKREFAICEGATRVADDKTERQISSRCNQIRGREDAQIELDDGDRIWSTNDITTNSVIDFFTYVSVVPFLWIATYVSIPVIKWIRRGFENRQA